MSYNKKAIADALSKMNKARKPKQVNDIIMDPEGQNKFPGIPTRIPSDNITMETTPYPVLGVDNFGNQQMMYPGANYTFPGADYVDEYPMMQTGGQRPILYVDPNDPAGRARYQAYQDSLAAYNFGSGLPQVWEKSDLDYFNSRYANNKGTVKRTVLKPGDKLEYPTHQTSDKSGKKVDAWQNSYKGVNPSNIGRSTLYSDGRIVSNLGVSAIVEYPIYQKPVQPIKYKPDPEVVAKQQQLINAGFDIGKADGIWGPKSEAAWEEFQKTQATEIEAIPQPTPEQAPTLEVAPLDNTPQRPVQTQTPPQAAQVPSGYNVWTHNGQPLDPAVYGWAPSNSPRQISQFADTHSLKRANEAYNKLGATPWATTGNKLVTDLYKPYFSKQAATNAIEQTAQQLGVPVEQLQIVKAPAGYSGYVVIQNLPQQKYGGLVTGLTNTSGNLLMNEQGKRMMAKSGSLYATNKLFLGNPLVTKRKKAVFVPGHDFQTGGEQTESTIENPSTVLPRSTINEYYNFRRANLIDLSLTPEQAREKYTSVNPVLFDAYTFFKNKGWTPVDSSTYHDEDFRYCSSKGCFYDDNSWNTFISANSPAETPIVERPLVTPETSNVQTPEQPPILPVIPLENVPQQVVTPQQPVPTQTPPQQPVQTNQPQVTPAPQQPSETPKSSEPKPKYHKEYNPYTGKNEPMSPKQKIELDRLYSRDLPMPENWQPELIETYRRQSGGATDWKSRIASTLNYQKGGQLSKEEFEKRKAAYKKMTGRDFEPPKSFKQSPQAREYYQNKYNQQPVIQSQPSETIQQSRGMSADEAEQLKIQNAPLDPRINQFSFEKDNRDPYTQKRDQYYAEQLTDPTGWNKVGHYVDAAVSIGGNLGNTIFGGDDWKNSLQNFEAFQLNPYNSEKDKLLNRADMVLSNVGNAFIDIGTAELGFVIPQLYKASFKKLLEIGSKANQRADVLQGVQGALDLFQGDASAIGDILLNVASYRSKMDNFDASTVYHNLNNWNKITKAEKIDTAKDIFNLFNAVYQQSQRTDPMQPSSLYQQGGQLSPEEFAKRKAAYEKLTGRKLEQPKTFKPSEKARQATLDKYNQLPVVQSQPSETVDQSRGIDTKREKEIVEAQANTDAKAAENYMHFYNKTYGSDYGAITYEQALQKVRLPNFDKAKYLNMYNLGQPKNEQLQSFRKEDQANRTWEVITNPFTAFEYAVTTGDMANMPSNINAARMQGYDVGATPGRNMVGNALNMTTNLFDAGDKVVRNVGEGNLLGAGMEALRFLPGARMTTGLGKQAGKYLKLPGSPNAVSSVDDIVMYRTQKPGQTEEILELMDLQKKANDIGIQNLSLPERVKLAEFQSRPNVGQAFDTDLTKINYYGNPNIRRTRGYTETPEVLRITVPRKQAELYNVKNFPEYAKQSTKRTEYILPMSIIQKAEKFSFDDLAKLQGALPGFGRQNVSTKLLQKEGIDFNLPIKPLNSPKSYESFYTPWSNPNIKDLNKILDEIKDANTWQKEWYNHPHRTSILDKAERTFQREIEAGNKSLISEYKGENPFTKMKKRIERENYKAIGVSSKSPLVEDLFLNKQTLPGTTPFGVSGYRPKMGGERQNIVFVDVASPTRARSTAVHEGNHGLTDANTLIPKYYQEDMVKIFGKNTQVPLRTEKGFASYDDYLKNPTEIYARVAEMRQVFKIKPDRVISEEDAVKMLNHIKAKKTPLPPEFAKAIKDPKKLAQVMNYLPAIGVVIGAASQYQEGGTTEEELTPAQLAMMKARLAYAHMHGNPSAQRMVAPVDNPYIFTGTEPYASPDTAGYSGTHYMFSQGPFAVPTIQTSPDGQLYYNVNASPNDSEAMQFDSPEDAEVFARYYKTVAPAFQDMELTDEEIEEYKRGGCTIVKL
jgi:hypothetical protein